MIRYISLRLLFALPALWLIVTMVFMLAHIVPGDPVAADARRRRPRRRSRPATSCSRSRPAARRPIRALSGGFLQGDLGESFRFQQPVTQRDFVALSRDAGAGHRRASGVRRHRNSGGHAAAAQRRGTSTDHAVGVFTLLGLSVPNFALGPVLILFFSVMLGWLPVSGRGGISHLVLPAVTLGAALAAILTRMVRGSVIEELSSDYVRTARAKGLRESAVLFRHAFRNALIPILTILGLQFGTLLAGTIVTETIFSWPGIGRLAVQAIEARDYPLLQGCILLIAVSYVRRESAHRSAVRLRRPAGALRMSALREFSPPARAAAGVSELTLLLVVAAPSARRGLLPPTPPRRIWPCGWLGPAPLIGWAPTSLAATFFRASFTARAFRCW